MFDRLEQLEERFMELEREMSDPAIVSDQARMQKVGKQHRDMQPVIERYREYKGVRAGVADAKVMLGESDEEMRAMAQEELATLEPRLAEIDEALKILLLPKDPNDDKNVVLEIRAATGGDEASLVCGGGLSHVPAVCRAAPLEGRNPERNREHRWRHEGRDGADRGRPRVQLAEV